MDADTLMQHVGQVSPYTLFLLYALSILNIFESLENMVMNFLDARLDHHCFVPELAGLPADRQRYIALPSEDGVSAECHQYDLPWYNFSQSELTDWNWTLREQQEVLQTTCQHGWVYDTSVFKLTTANEWDLVCDKEIILNLFSVVYMIGLLIGSLVSGPIAARYGRINCILLSAFLHVSGGVMAALAVSPWMYIAGRLLVGIGVRNGCISGVVLVMELFKPQFRTNAMIFYRLQYSMGVIMTAVTAYFVRDFRVLQLALSLPGILVIMYKWIIPESPSWLLSRGRRLSAVDVLQKIVQRSRTVFPPSGLEAQIVDKARSDVDKRKQKPSSHIGSRQLILHPACRLYFLASSFIMCTTIFIYISVSLNIGELFGDIYVNMALAGALEVPAILLMFATMNCWGRRPLLIVTLLVSGAFGALSIPFLYLEGYEMAGTVFLILSRSVAGCSSNIVTTMTGELFPTPIRQSALGYSNALAAIVSVFAPIAGGPAVSQIWRPLPAVIFSSLAFLSAAVVIPLPETAGIKMPETLEDAENIRRNKNNTKEDISADGSAAGNAQGVCQVPIGVDYADVMKCHGKSRPFIGVINPGYSPEPGADTIYVIRL